MEAAASRSAGAAIRTDSSKTVVLGTFRLVRQYIVSFLHFFEFGLGFFIAWVAVGVEFARQLAIGLFDLILSGALLHTQNVVIVASHSDGYIKRVLPSLVGESAYILARGVKPAKVGPICRSGRAVEVDGMLSRLVSIFVRHPDV